MSDLRIAVLGVGVMGADHVARITSRISNARVVVVNDYLSEKAEQIAASVPGARVVGDPLDAIADPDVDAVVLATPGPTHEKQLLACLEHGKPVLCEKPLTTDVETSLAVVKREAELGKQLIQVGFMRRFDHEYAQLKALIDGGEFGAAAGAALRAPQPRRPTVASTARWWCGTRWCTRSTSPVSCSARRSRRSRSSSPTAESRCAAGSCDPQIAIMRTESGKLRRRRTVRHHRRRLRGAHRTGGREGQRHDRTGRRPGAQEWHRAPGAAGSRPASASASGRPTTPSSSAGSTPCAPASNVDGPDAWDGYAAAAVCEAGVESLHSGRPVEVQIVDPDSIKGFRK